MLPRHANELLSRLERVLDIGSCEIRQYELLLWYSQKRMTVSIWRDIHAKWIEVLESAGVAPGIKLLVGQAAGGVWTFVWGEGLTTSPQSWLQDIDSSEKKNKNALVET